jgi:hypothetical protein
MGRTVHLPNRPMLVAAALTVGILIVVTGIYMLVDGDDEPVQAQPESEYPAWESPQLFNFPGDWDEISSVTVRTIYPFQTSWQRVTRPAHQGSDSVLAGTSCAACHGNPVLEQSSVGGWDGPPADHFQSQGCVACHGIIEQNAGGLGQSLANREFASEFGPGYKPGFVDVDVRAAYDDEYFYIRLEWASERPGISHDLLRFDGAEWVNWGGPKPDVLREDRLPSYEDRLTINIAQKEIPAYDGARGAGFASAGCFVSCHDSQRNMPREPSTDEVTAHPYFGEGGLGESDIRKYLLNTRYELDATGGWAAVKTEDEIRALLESGDFLDMWMWRASRGGPLGYADDNYVLEYRLGDDGTSAFATQGPPSYMYDASVTGFNAIPEDQFEEMLLEFPLIPGVNAVPFDPDVEFREGDILPRRVLRDPDGSRADILAHARWENGRWTVVMRRKLDTGNPEDVQLIPRSTYTIGIAVFDDHVSNRYHHVSFPVTIGLGVSADIVAAPLNEGR